MSKLHSKTSIGLLITAFTFFFLFNGSAEAQEDTAATTSATTTTKTSNDQNPGKSESYLKEIRDILLTNINKLPVYLNQLTKMALSWLTPDDSDTTAIQQKNFTNLTSAELKNVQIRNASQNRILYDFLKPNPSTPDEGLIGGRGVGPLIDSISYQTLLGQSFNQTTQQLQQQPQNEPAYNYIQFASALNIRHKKFPAIRPSSDKNYLAAVNQYLNYYMTTSAVQTYNGYILSELYADFKNQNAVKKARDALIQKASEPDWFTQIASENIGIVLRQILLYNSQTYVLLTQLLETQKKLLAAQTMNNALLIAVNQDTERRMYQRASGQPPTP